MAGDQGGPCRLHIRSVREIKTELACPGQLPLDGEQADSNRDGHGRAFQVSRATRR
jgi:hypothetical protein